MQTYVEPPLTVESLEAAPDDGNRYEVIEGELYVSSAPSYLHQRFLHRLEVALQRYLDEHPIGELLPGVGVIFDDLNGVIPDLIFVSNQRREQTLAGGRLMGAPEICIEILSPGPSNQRRDREVKRKLYMSHGVEEYWIVDSDAHTFEVHRPGKTSIIVSGNQALTSPLLPGFNVAVSSLFPETSR